MTQPLVGIVMGSDSDLPHLKEAADILSHFDIPHDVSIVSAHRTPHRVAEYAEEATRRGIRVIIAGAGGSAHLPGMLAAHTALPVIGVPVASKTLKGLDSLLSIVQMPPGVPVATVSIGGAKNAGILAAQIIGAYDESVHEKVRAYKESMRREVEAKDAVLKEEGMERFLKERDLI